jgi:hypothetical protein
LIALAAGLLDHTSKYPGLGALLPVGGAVLLLEARGSTVNRRFLSHPIVGDLQDLMAAANMWRRAPTPKIRW